MRQDYFTVPESTLMENTLTKVSWQLAIPIIRSSRR